MVEKFKNVSLPELTPKLFLLHKDERFSDHAPLIIDYAL